jgi:hypothetical protein
VLRSLQLETRLAVSGNRCQSHQVLHLSHLAPFLDTQDNLGSVLYRWRHLVADMKTPSREI